MGPTAINGFGWQHPYRRPGSPSFGYTCTSLKSAVPKIAFAFANHPRRSIVETTMFFLACRDMQSSIAYAHIVGVRCGIILRLIVAPAVAFRAYVLIPLRGVGQHGVVEFIGPQRYCRKTVGGCLMFLGCLTVQRDIERYIRGSDFIFPIDDVDKDSICAGIFRCI